MEKKIWEYFEGVETEREYTGYHYSVKDTITIAILGSLCGLKNVSQLHQWAASERVRAFLKEKWSIEKVPCYDWMLCLMKIIKPTSFNECFQRWAASLLPGETKHLTIAMDGKTVCSTRSMTSYEHPLHIISAQLSELGITLGQVSVEDKSNEIPAVQKLIRTQTIEKSRDRTEKRTGYVATDIGWLLQRKEWKNLTSIGAVKTEVENKKGKTPEWHYYISSRSLTAMELLHHARMEWAVESMHWLLDIHFDEDGCRVEDKNVQQNLNMLHQSALNVVKQFQTRTGTKRPMSKIMFDCLLDPSTIFMSWSKIDFRVLRLPRRRRDFRRCREDGCMP